MDKVPFRMYFDSEYLTGDSLEDGGTTFVIADKGRAEVEGHDGGKEHKLVLTFTDKQRFLCNVTNAKYLAHMLGSMYPADWVGHAVTLAFDDSIMFGKEKVGGIRVIGSPELTEPMTFMFAENSRKRPRPVTLVPTGPKVDTATGEVFEDAPIPAPVPADGPATDEGDIDPPGMDAAAYRESREPVPDNLLELPQRDGPATAQQLAAVKAARKASGVNASEFSSAVFAAGGEPGADNYGLSGSAADLLIADLKGRTP